MRFHAHNLFCFSLHVLFFISYLATWSLVDILQISFSSHQCGFMQKRSTVTTLACFSQYLAELIDNKGQVAVIFTDFQKAFDQIEYYILLE
jgi:hypothetical protein